MATSSQPAVATPSVADQWRGLSDDERSQALSRMSDDQKQQLASQLGFQGGGTTLTAKTRGGYPVAVGTPTQPPGFFSRLGESVGVPTSMEQLKAIPRGLVGPAGTGPVGAYVKNLYDKAVVPLTATEKANMASPQTLSFKQGPVGEAVNQGAKYILEGPLGPVGGQAVSNIATDFGSKGQPANLGAMGGDILGTIANLLTLRSAVGPSAEGQLNKLTYAAGSKAAGPLEKTMGMLNDTANATGAPVETVGHFKDLVNKTKDSINTEYGNAIGPYANMQIVPTTVSQKILGLITPDMQFTAEGRAEAKAIQNAALEYQKPWTLGALDSKRSRLAADLASHNAKEGVARYTAERGNTNLAIDNAINDALRDTVYPQADQLAGKPAGYFEDLKQKQSNLIRLQSLLNKRIDDLQGAQRAQEGAPLGAKVRGGVYATSEGAPHGYVGNLMSLLRSTIGKSGPLKDANAAVSSAFSTGGPVSKAMVLSYPIRKLALDQPTPWYEQDQK